MSIYLLSYCTNLMLLFLCWLQESACGRYCNMVIGNFYYSFCSWVYARTCVVKDSGNLCSVKVSLRDLLYDKKCCSALFHYCIHQNLFSMLYRVFLSLYLYLKRKISLWTILWYDRVGVVLNSIVDICVDFGAQAVPIFVTRI